MRKVIIWNKHFDCLHRMIPYLTAAGYEYESVESPTPPVLKEGEVMIVYDGWWLPQVPQEIRSRCLLLLTYNSEGHNNRRISEGFRACIAKEETVYEKWHTPFRVIVPPHIGLPKPSRTTGVGGIEGLIRDQNQYDPSQYDLTKVAGIKINGTLSPLVNDRALLKDLRWLWHTKSVGYICNAVVKALAYGVPILTNSVTIKNGGYELMLKDGVNCVVRENPIELRDTALGVSQEGWERLSLNAYECRHLFCDIQAHIPGPLGELIEKVATI